MQVRVRHIDRTDHNVAICPRTSKNAEECPIYRKIRKIIGARITREEFRKLTQKVIIPAVKEGSGYTITLTRDQKRNKSELIIRLEEDPYVHELLTLPDIQKRLRDEYLSQKTNNCREPAAKPAETQQQEIFDNIQNDNGPFGQGLPNPDTGWSSDTGWLPDGDLGFS